MTQPKIRLWLFHSLRDVEKAMSKADPKECTILRSSNKLIYPDHEVYLRAYQGRYTTQLLQNIVLDSYTFHESCDQVNAGVVNWLNSRVRPND